MRVSMGTISWCSLAAMTRPAFSCRSTLRAPFCGIALSCMDPKGAKQMCCTWGINPLFEKGVGQTLTVKISELHHALGLDDTSLDGTSMVTGQFELPLENTILVRLSHCPGAPMGYSGRSHRRWLRQMQGKMMLEGTQKAVTCVKHEELMQCSHTLQGEAAAQPAPLTAGHSPTAPLFSHSDVNINCLNVAGLDDPFTGKRFGWIGIGDYTDRELDSTEEHMLLSLRDLVLREIQHVSVDIINSK